MYLISFPTNGLYKFIKVSVPNIFFKKIIFLKKPHSCSILYCVEYLERNVREIRSKNAKQIKDLKRAQYK